MQRFERVPCLQTVQFLEPNTLRPSAICGRRLLFQKEEKTEHQRVHRQFGLRQVWFFLDPGTPVSLDVRFTDDPSLPSCLPNMPRQLSKSGGSLLVANQLHDVNDMRSQVASYDPNGPRAPLLSNFDPDAWEPTESPGDQLSLQVVVGQTGKVHRMDPVACRPVIKCRMSGCAGACTPSEVVHGYQAGKETLTCKICVTTFPRYEVTLADFDSYQNASLAISRRPSWVPWSDLPRAPLIGNRFGPLRAQRVEIPCCVRHVLCRWIKRSVFRVREPCCFTPLRWRRDVDEFLKVIRQVLWKRYITRATCTIRHVSA